MARLFIEAALFCVRMGDKEQAIVCTKRALAEANREGLKSCAGHLMAALNKGRKS